MKIVFIRHAEPDYEHNTLTPKGFIEAEALGEMYHDEQMDEIHVSTLPRAIFTADALIKGTNKTYQLHSWLEEFFHKITMPDGSVKHTWDYKPNFFFNYDKKFYDNDTYLDTEIMKSGDIKAKYDEVIKNFDEILKNNGYERNGNLYKVTNSNHRVIVFVCHFGMMSVLMSRLMNIPYTTIAEMFMCPPSGVTIFNSEEREEGIAYFRCSNYGDVSHLKYKGLEKSFHGRFCECFEDDTRH